MSALGELLRAGAAPDAIQRHLEGLDHSGRVAEVRALGARELARLWALCAGQPVELEHYVPATTPAGREVRHLGINSLPFFRRFEKRFVRTPAATTATDPAAPPVGLWGYNHQPLAPLTGPGYFGVAARPAGSELEIDYHRVPAARPLPDWPAVASNERLPARWIYGFTRDAMRRASAHVSIGRAIRKGRPTGNYFALVRES